jgi:2-succinyl-6-hydroxy-2,4-cyclohexadiene-1-carboxylate synthase
VVGSGPALLLLHGFTGSGLSWDGGLTAAAVGAGFSTIAPDLPGHGDTAWRAGDPADPGDSSRATIERSADDLPVLLRALGHDRANVVGYSMGARVALRLAIAHPACVARIVLEAPSAGIVGAAGRAARRAADDALARTLERGGIGPFIDAWERTPVLAGEARLGAGARAALREIRVAHDPAGLAASLRAAGQGAMEPLHGRLGEIASPTLVVVGADDPVRDRAAAVAAGIPGAHLAVIDGAGHAPHLESPAAFISLVIDFLQEDHAA